MPEAAGIARALEPFDLAWLEVDCFDPGALADLRSRSPIPMPKRKVAFWKKPAPEGEKPTTLSPKQADYLGVAVEGPYKPDHYRY